MHDHRPATLTLDHDVEHAVQRDVERDAVAESVASTDGRRSRRVRNKVAVIDAYLDLVSAGNERPSVAEVAARSGVSHRSVFRYFADKDDLARSSIDRQINRVGPQLLLELGPDADLDDRIRHLIERRFQLFEVLAPVARLMRMMAPEDPAIRQELTRTRLVAREQIRDLFAPELGTMAQDTANEVLGVIDVLCSFESGELFVWDLGFTPQGGVHAIERVLRLLLRAR